MPRSKRHVVPRIDEGNPNHFSVFAFANQPLLILLGVLLTDKVPAELYQLHREPAGWRWQAGPENFSFRTIAPQMRHGTPALVISLSARIDPERITSILGPETAIWELTIDESHNDFLKSRAQLAAFRETARKLIVEIAHGHGQRTSLNIFPAMPVACAVELGRVTDAESRHALGRFRSEQQARPIYQSTGDRRNIVSTTTEHRILEAIAKTIDIPDSAYDAAGRRYRDLGVWFAHPGSFCAGFDPHIYAQGSFRLGTVNRPLGDDEAYDLDLACKLRQGVSKITHTQEQVKTLVGNDVKSYRKARTHRQACAGEASLLASGICRRSQLPYRHRPLHSRRAHPPASD